MTMQDPLLGKQLLRRYRIEQALGSGGMADVYRAWDLNRNYEVALKFLKPQFVTDPAFLQRFWAEARHLEQLRHRNIVRYLGVEREGQWAFIVMEYVAGQTLSERLRDDHAGMLTVAEILDIIEQVASALYYAHSENIVHLDVKPGNIILGQDGQVYLTDLGIATAISRSMPELLLSGTAAYMAPEQCEPGPVDHRADIYALAVIAFQMLTGIRPFRGETASALPATDTTRRIRWEQRHSTPPPVRHYRPDLPPHLEHVMQRALAKNPHERYQSALTFSQELKTVLHFAMNSGAGQGPPPLPDEPSAPPSPAPRPPRRQAGVIVTVIGALLLVIVLGVVLMQSEGALDGEAAANSPGTAGSATLFVTSTRRPSATPAGVTESEVTRESVPKDDSSPVAAAPSVSPRGASPTAAPPAVVEPSPPVTPAMTRGVTLQATLPGGDSTAPAAPVTRISPSPVPVTLSPTGLPTIASPTATQVRVQGRVTAVERVNLRSGPGTRHEVIGGRDPDSFIIVDGRNSDGSWLHVVLPDVEDAWISADLVRLASGTVDDLPVTE